MDCKKAKSENDLSYLIAKCNRELQRRLLHNFKEIGLDVTPEQWNVLINLWEKDGISQQELSDITGKDSPSITRLIDTMSKRNLVERRADESDRRTNLIFLTLHCKKLKQNLENQAQTTLNEATHNLNEEEITFSKKVLLSILQNLEKL